MNRSLKGPIDYAVHTTDGEIGRVTGFYFEENSWQIRYLIVKMGTSLFSRKVLIAPSDLLTPDWTRNILPVNLSKQQILQIPDHGTEENPYGNLHLQNTTKVAGYHVQATDVPVGTVADFLIDDIRWAIDFLVVSTGRWTDSKNILISTEWVKEAQWANSLIVVDIFSDRIKKAPAFDKTHTFTETDTQTLFDHYDRARRALPADA